MNFSILHRLRPHYVLGYFTAVKYQMMTKQVNLKKYILQDRKQIVMVHFIANVVKTDLRV